MTAQIFGFLLAIYFLVGRWSLGRLDGATGSGTLFEQPRFWIVAALVPIVLLLRPRTTRDGLRGRPTSVDLAVCWFLAYMILTTLWAPSAELANNKAGELALILWVAVLIAATRPALAHGDIQHGFWCMIVVVGIAMASLAILYRTGGRIYVPSGGPNTFGRNMGLLGIGAAYLAARYGQAARPACVAAIVVAMLMVLLCGSRGGLLSASVAVATFTVTARTSLSSKILIIAVLAGATAVAVSFTDVGRHAADVFHSRIVEQTLENRYLAARDVLWTDAWEMVCAKPLFGWGLNGFRANSWTYPHNIFLESLVEGGGVGLALLLMIPWVWWRRFRHSGVRISRVQLAALALLLTAAQTSGDLFDSRGVFLLIALATPTTVVARHAASSRKRNLAQLAVPRLDKNPEAIRCQLRTASARGVAR
jgi:O-antigen ligase